MKLPKLTLTRLLGITAVVALVISILIPSHPVDPPTTERVLGGIANATSSYISQVGSFPRSLEDIREIPALRLNRDPPTYVGDLPLNGIRYTPEFLELPDRDRVILAYVGIPEKKECAVLYYRARYGPGDVIMRSGAELEAELRSLREQLAEKVKTQGLATTQPSASGPG